MNAANDGRGRLRVTLCTQDFQAARRVTRGFLPGRLADLEDALPPRGMAMLGLAYGTDGAAPRKRWYRLAPAGQGAGLSYAAGELFPQLKGPTEALAQLCGGRANCMAVGIEVDDAGHTRSTVYFRLDGPERLRALFEREGFPEHPRTRIMLDEVLAGGDRTWPKTWIGHCVGRHGGWKLYYFARRDPFRVSDGELLDVVDASPGVRAACDRLTELLPPEKLKACPNGTVQLVALRLDGDPPGWTLYLAPR